MKSCVEDARAEVEGEVEVVCGLSGGEGAAGALSGSPPASTRVGLGGGVEALGGGGRGGGEDSRACARVVVLWVRCGGSSAEAGMYTYIHIYIYTYIHIYIYTYIHIYI